MLIVFLTCFVHVGSLIWQQLMDTLQGFVALRLQNFGILIIAAEQGRLMQWLDWLFHRHPI